MFKVKVGSTEISINVKAPDESGFMECPDESLIKELVGTFALYHSLGEWASPIDLIAALHNECLSYEIVEGAEILDFPREELPEGAIP